MIAITPRRPSWVIWTLLIVAFFLVIGTGFYWILSAQTQQTDLSLSSNTAKTVAPVTVSSVQSKMLFTGNTFWGRYVNDWAMKQSDRYAAPFSRLNEFDRSAYNAWITGLECPTTQKGASMSSADMQATLTFNCDPVYLPEFAKWFTAVTLANNHTDNQGVEGFAETQKALDASGIQYFGTYDPENLSDLCDVVAMPVTVTMSDSSTKEGKLPVALCGYHGVFHTPSAASLEEVSRYAEYMPVIAMPHSGQEYVATPDIIKTTMDHTLIDNGADMVIGDHSHWVQTTEAYKGKLIVYSMGNFLFDQQVAEETVRSAAIQVTLDATGDDALLTQWLSLGEQCTIHGDTCLAQAKEQGLTKIDAHYTFGVVATDDRGFVTHPASAEVQASVESRLNWQQTMKELGQ